MGIINITKILTQLEVIVLTPISESAKYCTRDR